MKCEIENMRNTRGRHKGQNYDNPKRNNGRKNMCKKTGHHHEWKDCTDNPINRRNESNIHEREVKFNEDDKEIEDREFNMMEEHNNLLDIEEEGPMLLDEPTFKMHRNIENEETHIVNNMRAVKKIEDIREETSKKIRVSCVFTLEDNHGNKTKYLGLLDTGSTKILSSEELVRKYEMKTMKDNG